MARLEIEDLEVGDGPSAGAGANVQVHYTGWLADGTVFDSSVTRGEPFGFKLCAGQVIAGWDSGVTGMKAGGKRKLTIPPAMAYGARGFSNLIPPNSTLVFEIELLQIG